MDVVRLDPRAQLGLRRGLGQEIIDPRFGRDGGGGQFGGGGFGGKGGFGNGANGL